MFNVSTITADETLIGAELRLFRGNNSLHLNQSKTDNISSEEPSKYRIGIYEILKPASQFDEAVSRLIDTRVVDSSRTQWETFDIHTAVLRWHQKPHENHGLHVRVTSLETQEPSGGHHIRLRRSLLRPSSSKTSETSAADESWMLSERQWAEQQPFLVTYSEDAQSQASGRTRRL